MSHRRHPVWKTVITIAADFLAVGAGLLFAYWFRFHAGLLPIRGGYSSADYLGLLPWAIITGSIMALLMLFTYFYFTKSGADFSRGLMAIVFLPVVGFLLIERAALHLFFTRLHRTRGLGLTRTLIVGGGPVAARVFETLQRHPEHGMAPIGLVVENGDSEAERRDLPVLGRLHDLERILDERDVEEVILAGPKVDRARIPGLLALCERHLASFRIVPETAELLLSGMSVELMHGIPLLGARPTPLQGWNAALKRGVDVVAAVVGIIVLSPLMALIAWTIRRRDGATALYFQERMGIDGRVFPICKFRTMRPDAEVETGPVFADDNDARCTPLGAWLRRYRLDELPQLFNVLKGEMSLVGPRPERPFFIERFREDIPHYMSRHKVKSGITGWAQINGLCGKHGSIGRRLEYDLYYIENWSIWFDFKIMVATLLRAVGVGS
jgi:exopolysaccharide biosynthesis polyprenyl glycosylphosphotransferase